MKILLIHNKYQQAGGEDLVFRLEGDLLSNHGHIVERLIFDNKEIQTTGDKLMSGLKAIYNPESYRRVHNAIKHSKPDIIHVHNFFPIASPSIFFAAKKNNISVVVTLHNFRLICPSATLFFNNAIYEKSIGKVFPWDAIIKGVYRNSKLQTAALAVVTTIHNLIGTWTSKVDKFIVLTEFARNKFKEAKLKISPEDLVVKPNFVVDDGIGEPVRDNVFLYVGRLTEEKGIDVLLEALKVHEFKLVIIGDGPMRDVVEDFSKTNANLCYLGFRSKDIIVDYLKKSKALLFPSKWYEGFPMTILEAFSTGTPVIASRLGSMAEIVIDKVNGLHFEPGSANDLVDKIIKITGDLKLSATLSENARKSYADHYMPEENYKILMDIYKEAQSKKVPELWDNVYGK